MSTLKDELMKLETSNQKELSESLKEINDLAEEAYQAKLDASEVDAFAKELKGRLCSLMETAGVDKISANSCTVSGKIKSSSTLPKDEIGKREVLKYMGEVEGAEVLAVMMTVNPKVFSSWYDKHAEILLERGEDITKTALKHVKPYDYYAIGMRKKS